ncbi:MAG TPA: PBSX family phage terminase large subunit [Mycobacteriales bacterium]
MHVAPLAGKALDAVRLSTARINIWEGAVRSSKTVGSTIRWVQFVRNAPPGNLIMVGRTERTLKRNIIDPLIEMLGASRCRLVSGSGELWLLGRRVYLVGANDERAQDKIRGLTLLGAYVDEVSTIPESFWTMLLSRLSEPGAKLFGTTNPDGPAHWLKRDYLDRATLHLDRHGDVSHTGGDDRLDLHRFSFQLADNPHLSPDYVTSLSKEYVGLWHRRFILGEWVQAEGSIYDCWDPARHVVDILPAITRWVGVGVDHGTTNPFDAVTLGVGTDGRLYLTAEYRYDSRRAHRQLSDVEYSQRFRDWLADVPIPGSTLRGVAPEWTVVDPAATGFRVQLHHDGLPSVAADNAVVDGIRTVSSLLAGGRLKVHRSCTDLIREIPGYVWDPKATAAGHDAPIKVDDHSVDAARYVIRTTEAAWRPLLAREAA